MRKNHQFRSTLGSWKDWKYNILVLSIGSSQLLSLSCSLPIKTNNTICIQKLNFNFFFRHMWQKKKSIFSLTLLKNQDCYSISTSFTSRMTVISSKFQYAMIECKEIAKVSIHIQERYKTLSFSHQEFAQVFGKIKFMLKTWLLDLPKEVQKARIIL